MTPWEFDNDLDTSKSFQGFAFYRDLGPTRSLEGAYQVYKHQDRIKTVPGFFREWCQKGKWVDRAHAFDLESDRIRLERMQGEAHREHDERLEQVRSIAETLAITRLSTSLQTAEIIRDTIARLYDDCAVMTDKQTRHVITAAQAEFLAALVGIQSKDSGSIEASLNLAQEALGIQELMEKMNPQ
jgi:hypothetical protein